MLAAPSVRDAAVTGYTQMNASDRRVSCTVHGFAERVFRAHLRIAGDDDELLFRDYLREHADIAREYEILKLSL